MPDVTMPRLSDSMEEGTILRWLKADGDEVRRGDELAEIETDKATMTYEADGDGTLEIVAGEGDTLPVGAVIARLSAPGSAPASSGNGAAVAAEAAAAPPAQSAPPVAVAPPPSPPAVVATPAPAPAGDGAAAPG